MKDNEERGSVEDKKRIGKKRLRIIKDMGVKEREEMRRKLLRKDKCEVKKRKMKEEERKKRMKKRKDWKEGKKKKREIRIVKEGRGRIKIGGKKIGIGVEEEKNEILKKECVEREDGEGWLIKDLRRGIGRIIVGNGEI